MKPLFILAAILFCISFFSCKSTKKYFEKGQYEQAFYSAVNDLKKNPSNESASQILPDAYKQATKQLLNLIHTAEQGTRTVDKLDKIYSSYNSLQRMYDALLSSPAANSLVRARDFSSELATAADEGAGFHYASGLDLFNLGDKKSAQKAYEEFTITDSYVPGFKDVTRLKDEAWYRAVTNIALNNVNQQFGSYSVNGSFLDNDILNNLNNIGRNYYNRFYLVPEAQSKQIRVDQFMDVMMYDIWFGHLATNTYSYDVSKTIKEPVGNTKETKSVTVTATVRVTRRIMESRAAMDCRITDAETRRILHTERFPANYTWEKLTGSYTGDSRALSDKDKAIINGVYNNPPDYSDLYRELAKKVLNDFGNRMRQIYGS